MFPAAVNVLTLFVTDLGESREFYERAFGMSVIYSDNDSAVFRFGATLVNLLAERAAPELIDPATVADGQGVRAVYTITVDDVRSLSATLEARGVMLLNGPVDRPWGVRTASFRDPSGHLWEIAQQL
jgi:catechol 2,3-dioxygenase-like lactoylglutathione lyase family enzyme